MGKKLCAIIICAVFLGGCSKKNVEIQNRAFIKTIGVDGGKTEQIAVNLFGDDDIVSYDGNGKTIFKAIENAEQTQDKNLFTGHLETAVFSGENFKTDLRELLTDNRISPACKALYSTYNAADIVSSEDYDELLGTMESKNKIGTLVECNLGSVFEDMLGKDGMAVIALINRGELQNGIVNKNGLVASLTNNEAEGVCWLLGSPEKVTIVTQDKNGNKVNVEIRDIRSSVCSSIEDGKVYTTFKISCNGVLPDGTDKTKSIEYDVCSQIAQKCSAAVNRTVYDLSADVLSIEKSIKAADYGFYRDNIDDWETLTKNIQFEYNIDVNM